MTNTDVRNRKHHITLSLSARDIQRLEQIRDAVEPSTLSHGAGAAIRAFHQHLSKQGKIHVQAENPAADENDADQAVS